MKAKLTSIFACACAAIISTRAQDQATPHVKVTPATYIHAETDRQFGNVVKWRAA